MGTNFYWEVNPETKEPFPDECFEDDDPRCHIGKRSANSSLALHRSRFTFTDEKHIDLIDGDEQLTVVDEYGRVYTHTEFRAIVAECCPIDVVHGRWC